MSSPVIVISQDNIRGAILEKILSRGGFDVLLFKSVFEAEDVLKECNPRVLVFDTKGLKSRETGFLEKLRSHLPWTFVIALVEASATPRSVVEVSPREVWLAEPLDPELIVSRVREIESSLPAEKASDAKPGKDTFMTSLKQLLKLD
jgi:DNA-binding NtrC family response regulator